ncbi:extracellular solute-binding protein [Shinella zoogloeoides]|uniref:ABC transporter substrate-binding protein n=1 Tax=Shinella zoogloeoides TaxID=352475 RepID=UPI0028A6C95A|nr:extracellular solute-binding protein [Shinella zoogloeoides]
MPKDELLAIIAFLEELRGSALAGIGLRESDPYWNMSLYIMRRHLEGKSTSVSGLAASALIPYGSAMRRIDEMVESELIFKRVRTATGRSYSVHPTPELIQRTVVSLERVKRLIGRVSMNSSDRQFYLGGSYLGEREIASPTALEPPVGRGETIDILVQDDPTFKVLIRHQRELQEWLGGRIRITAMKMDRLRQETLANAREARSRYDIVAVDMTWTGEYASDNILLPLTPLIAKADMEFADFHPTASQAAHFGGVQYAIPIQAAPELLLCRSDLLDAHGLKAPETTDDVIEAAKLISARRGALYGIAWRAGRGLPIAHSFVQFMASFGQPPVVLPSEEGEYFVGNLEDDALEPALTCEAAYRAAEFMLRLKAVSPPNIGQMDAEDAIAAYAKGDVAMVYAWSCRASRFELDYFSPARANTVYLAHPHGPGAPAVSPIGGYLLGIPANLDPRRVHMAWRVISWLVSPEALKFYVQSGSFASPRFSVSADPEVARSCHVIGAVDRLAQTGQIKLWPRPPIPKLSLLFDILGEEIHDMLMGSKTVDAALSGAQRRAQALLRASNPKERLYALAH